MAEGTAPGLLLGKYTVERVLGEGGMGRVLAVRHAALERSFAMKVILPSLAEDPVARRKFVKEARAAARLTSPHAARVFDSGELEDGSPYMVLELLEGRDLAGFTTPERRLSPGALVCVALQVLDALADAHGNDLVHRDLKPENVFLVGEPERPDARVLDFGIARDLRGATTTTGLQGTPQYISPEQLRGEPADRRVDLWALGVILYECSAGRAPFDGASVGEIFGAILRHDVPALPAEVPAGLAAVVERALRRDVADRFQSASEMAEALLPLLPEALRPLLPLRWVRAPGPPETPPLPAPVPAAARRPVAVAGLAVALAGILGFVLFRSGGAPAPAAAPGAPAPSSVSLPGPSAPRGEGVPLEGRAQASASSVSPGPEPPEEPRARAPVGTAAPRPPGPAGPSSAVRPSSPPPSGAARRPRRPGTPDDPDFGY